MRSYVDLVECKECKYKNHCNRIMRVQMQSEEDGGSYLYYAPINYCSFGERKNDD